MSEQSHTRDREPSARKQWAVQHFAQSNPDGHGQGDVPALLRRVADTIAKLGDVTVQDITFSSQATAGEPDLTMTVYYIGGEAEQD